MTQRTNLEKLNKAIELLGGNTKFSLAIGISYQTVMSWKHGRRSPSALYCLKIEQETKREIKAKDILPDYPWNDFKEMLK